MLSWPTKSFRIKAAAAVAALYALCILLPATAFAMADGRMAPPCLMDDLAAASMHDHGAMPMEAVAVESHVVHQHHHHAADDAPAVAMTHHHDGEAPMAGGVPPDDTGHGKSRPGTCCGLFPTAALASTDRAAPLPSRLASRLVPLMTDALVGRGPDRIIRPPIA